MMMKKHNKTNGYPKPTRIVLYSHKKHLMPIPQVGKKYHCFDDGKITFSRHFIIQVDEILGHQEFKRKYPQLFQIYREAVKSSYWLYSTHSDKFIITHKGENNELGAYTRTKQGDWFGIGEYWNSATLDVTGNLWNQLITDINNFNYTQEEKEKIISENTI